MRFDKLSARSELMIFLGYDGSNYRFMRHQAGNVIFVSPHAIFDETFFPKCPNLKPSENVQERLEKESRSLSHSECDDVEGQNDLDLFSPSHPLNLLRVLHPLRHSHHKYNLLIIRLHPMCLGPLV
jgi:hypothetical protein